MEKEIWTQVVVEDTVIGNASKYTRNDKDNNKKVRNRMESHTHVIIFIQTKENGHGVTVPNKAKYNSNNKVLRKEYRGILHGEEDDQFAKG